VARYDIRPRRSHPKTFHHPDVGPLTLHHEVLRLDTGGSARASGRPRNRRSLRRGRLIAGASFRTMRLRLVELAGD
jgi:hypothetical protein